MLGVWTKKMCFQGKIVTQSLPTSSIFLLKSNQKCNFSHSTIKYLVALSLTFEFYQWLFQSAVRVWFSNSWIFYEDFQLRHTHFLLNSFLQWMLTGIKYPSNYRWLISPKWSYLLTPCKHSHKISISIFIQYLFHSSIGTQKVFQ